MRVIGGRYRGRTIECPPGVIRPAMDKMRESVFGSLGDLSGHSFLDLFSGSGSVGIEAASRGADPVVLVERDRRKLSVIRRNMAIVESGITLAAEPAERYLRRITRSFDLLFMDPPFDYRFKVDLLRKADESQAVSAASVVLIHHPTRESLPERVGTLLQVDWRVYGGSTVSWYRRSSANGPSESLPE